MGIFTGSSFELFELGDRGQGIGSEIAQYLGHYYFLLFSRFALASGTISIRPLTRSQAKSSQYAQFSRPCVLQHDLILHSKQWLNLIPSSGVQPVQLMSSGLISALYISDHSAAAFFLRSSSLVAKALKAGHSSQASPQ